MNLDNIHSVYFLGIGGIGMSALARWFNANGYSVAGYDKTVTELTRSMQEEGIEIHYQDSADNIPEKVKNELDGSLIVYTPAIPKDLEEYNYFLDLGVTVYKRSQVLGFLTESKYTIAVAGTHGKTTTSSMIAHLLKSSGVNCSAFVGGIMTNYNSNILIGEKNEIIVVEADEFDRSFLTLHPDVAIITATDADHLDIYGSKDSLKDSFKDFIGRIKNDGKLFIEEKAAQELDLVEFSHLSIRTYGINSGQIKVTDLSIDDGKFKFKVSSKDFKDEFELAMPGYHNVSNALVALSVVREFISQQKKLVEGMKSYEGVKRRFEYIINNEDLVFIDDYAHHPDEIRALLESARDMYPNKEITVVFQPHLFSRTRDFVDGFAESLAMADKIVLLDIYPAREKPIEGITSDVIKEKIKDKVVVRHHMEDVLEYFNSEKPEVLLTVGAGDIDTLVEPIKNKLLS